jgi:hypothetical protein
MLKELAKKLGFPVRDRKTFDPASLDDQVATRTGWNPAKGGGASFCTHRLVRKGPNRLEFQTSAGARLFYLLFIVVGLGMMIGFSIGGISGNSSEVFIPLLAGFVFTTVGGVMLYLATTPVIFDKQRGSFWKSRQDPAQITGINSSKNFARLKDIHALQLVSEYCRGNKNSFYSYELNLVLTNTRRINVVDHGSVERLQEDARTLAAFLDNPVWDATVISITTSKQ